jgi:LPXTG-site transpeptidase (sortase) family protein
LGYCALTVAETKFYQRWAYEELRSSKAEPPSFDRTENESIANTLDSALQRNGFYAGLNQNPPLAEIEIPRIHVSAMVTEGASARALKLAVGHIPGTALPGQTGNVALAGHRDTFFRQLENVRPGDVIKLTTYNGQYLYQVRYTKIVSPDATWALNPSPSKSQTLTLVTCYPFYYVGAAPKRFVVRASRL